MLAALGNKIAYKRFLLDSFVSFWGDRNKRQETTLTSLTMKAWQLDRESTTVLGLLVRALSLTRRWEPLDRRQRLKILCRINGVLVVCAACFLVRVAVLSSALFVRSRHRCAFQTGRETDCCRPWRLEQQWNVSASGSVSTQGIDLPFAAVETFFSQHDGKEQLLPRTQLVQPARGRFSVIARSTQQAETVGSARALPIAQTGPIISPRWQANRGELSFFFLAFPVCLMHLPSLAHLTPNHRMNESDNRTDNHTRAEEMNRLLFELLARWVSGLIPGCALLHIMCKTKRPGDDRPPVTRNSRCVALVRLSSSVRVGCGYL